MAYKTKQFKVIQHPRSGRKYKVPVHDDHLMRLMGLEGQGGNIHWQAQINNTLRQSFYQTNNLKHIAVDVGAHIGMNTIEFADLYHKVYTFEPVPEIFECLTETVRLNVKDTTRIHMYNAAVGSIARDVSMQYNDTNTLATQTRASGSKGSKFSVTQVTLDEVIPKDQTVALIKLDCEGVELEALKGAERILMEQSPVLLFEWKPHISKKYTTSNTEIFTWLLEHCGYTIANKYGQEIDISTIKGNRVQLVMVDERLGSVNVPTYCDFFATRGRKCRYSGGRFVWS